jgi:hypothetical protein
MSDHIAYDIGAPSIEVRIFREGRVIARELCESEEQAELLVERYADERGMTFEVEDLSLERRPGEILASPSIGFDEGYEADGLAAPEQEGER